MVVEGFGFLNQLASFEQPAFGSCDAQSPAKSLHVKCAVRGGHDDKILGEDSMLRHIRMYTPPHLRYVHCTQRIRAYPEGQLLTGVSTIKATSECTTSAAARTVVSPGLS